MNPSKFTSLLVSGLFLAASCGGSGTSTPTTGEIEGLATPSQVSVVSAQSDEVAVGAGGVTPGAGNVTFPADSDFATDQTTAWVYDPSMDPIQQVNAILCFISQTAADALVNEGPYLAQINAERCEQGRQQDDSDGQSSAGAQEFELWTIDSSRATRTSSQLASFWVPSDGEDDATIHVRAEVTAAPSDTNPLGSFSLDFAGLGMPIGDPLFLGTLSTASAAPGFIGYTFYEESGDLSVTPASGEYASRTAVNVTMTEDSTAGVARISAEFAENFGGGPTSGEEEYLVAFDETHMLRSIGDDEVCLSRETFTSNVWRYNLYHADGEELGDRVELTSGFGFKTEEGGFGWVGYHGVWSDGDVVLEDGDEITRENFDDESDPEIYTIRSAPGRLIRNAQKEIALEDIVGKTFEWFPPYDGQGEPAGQKLIQYDGMNWMATHEMDFETGQFDELEAPVMLDVETLFWLGMWSQELNGSVNYLFGDDFVTIYENEFITAGSEVFSEGVDQLELHGYFEMLDSEVSQGELETDGFFLEDRMDVEDPHVFFFGADDLTLVYAANGMDDENVATVGLAEGVTISPDSPNSWGVRSGPMVLASNSSSLSNVFDIFAQNEFYQYETGPNPWNRFTGVEDSDGDMVVFDPPIQFRYTHSTANDRDGSSEYDGQTYFLNYNGPGQLGGIPFEGVDIDGDEVEDRYYPVFNLADGVLVGPEGTEYAVKAIELEQQLAVVPGECTELDLTAAEALELPTVEGWTFPDIGDMPVVTDAPAVVDGVVQRADS